MRYRDLRLLRIQVFSLEELDAGGIISPMTSVVTSDARLYDAKYLLRVEWKVSD